MPDNFKETSSGLIIPTTAVDDGVARDAAEIAAWAKSWPKPGEKRLNLSDITDIVLFRGKQFLWERGYTEQVHKKVVALLGLNVQQTPPTRRQWQAKRSAAEAANNLPGLRVVANGCGAGHSFQVRGAFQTCVRCGAVERAPSVPGVIHDPQDTGQPSPTRGLDQTHPRPTPSQE